MVSIGEFGLLHYTNDVTCPDVVHYPAVGVKPADIVNTNGAGDSFVGAASAALGQGMGLDAAIRTGLSAAQLSVQSETAVSANLNPTVLATLGQQV